MHAVDAAMVEGCAHVHHFAHREGTIIDHGLLFDRTKCDEDRHAAVRHQRHKGGVEPQRAHIGDHHRTEHVFGDAGPRQVEVERVGKETDQVEPQGAGGILREFGVGAQILRDLGLSEVRLLTNTPRKLAGIDGYGLAVKEIVPTMLVGEGVFVPRAVGKDYEGKHFGIRNMGRRDPRCPPKASTILNGALDFVDIHVYYTNPSTTLEESYSLDMKSTGLYSQEMQGVLKDKPYILGEFGSFKFVASTFDQARKNILKTRDLALGDHARGYMMWTFDTFEQRCIWQAMEDEAFLKELSDY